MSEHVMHDLMMEIRNSNHQFLPPNRSRHLFPGLPMRSLNSKRWPSVFSGSH
jgi:hypothetical protein